MEYLASLPAELRIPGAIEEIRSRVAENGRRVVVLDGDPTGTQTVHGVPVLTTWSVEDLRGALRGPSPTFYVLTNSRSFSEGEAIEINREIAANLALAAEQAGAEGVLTRRGYSTVRAHSPADFQTVSGTGILGSWHSPGPMLSDILMYRVDGFRRPL